MTGGIVIRDEAMAAAVPLGSWVTDPTNGTTIHTNLPSIRPWLVGCTLTNIAVPVAEAQAMRAEMLAEAAELRRLAGTIRPWPGTAHPDPGAESVADSLDRCASDTESRAELLFPEAVFDAPPPAPEMPSEVTEIGRRWLEWIEQPTKGDDPPPSLQGTLRDLPEGQARWVIQYLLGLHLFDVSDASTMGPRLAPPPAPEARP